MNAPLPQEDRNAEFDHRLTALETELPHLATKLDITHLAAEMRQGFAEVKNQISEVKHQVVEVKHQVDEVKTELTHKIDDVKSELTHRIDDVAANGNAQAAQLRSELQVFKAQMEVRMYQTESSVKAWVTGCMIALFAALAAAFWH